MFLNPMMLIFLGAAVVPVVLHLLSRSRQTTVRWGAMMFLDEGEPRRSRFRRVREWAVLGLRCLAVALLAVGLARPVTDGGGVEGLALRSSAAVEGGRVAMVLVADVSGSTSASGVPGTTRLDGVKEAASRVLASLEQGDVVALLPGDGRRLGPAEGKGDVTFSADRGAVVAQVAGLQSRAGALDVGAALMDAARLLGDRGSEGGASGREARVVVIVTDEQASSYASLTGALAARWEAVRRAAGISRVVFIPTGDNDRDNVSVESVEVVSGPVLRGRPAEVRVSLRNDGPTPRSRFPVQVGVPGVPVVKGTVDLAADATGTWKASLTFPVAGRVVLSAECGSAGPEFDDRAETVVDVGSALKVLVVKSLPVAAGSGEDERVPGATLVAGVTDRGDQDAVQLALTPFTGNAAGNNGAVITEALGGGALGGGVAAGDAGGAVRFPVFTLGAYDVVVIPHLQRLTDAEATALSQFVYGGGGLVVGVGPLTDEKTLARLGSVLPARVGEASTWDGMGTEVRGMAEAHPITGYAWSPERALAGARVRRYRSLTLTAGAKPVFEAAVGGGRQTMLMADGKYGSGRVVLSGFALDGSWSDVTRSPGFLPLVQSAVRWVSGSEGGRGQLAVGDMLRVTLPEDADARSVVLEGPALGLGGVGRVVPAVDRRERGLQVTWGPVVAPGVYEVRYRAGGRDGVEPVVVRAVASESDLRAGEASVAEAAQRVSARVVRLDGAAAKRTGTLAGIRYGRELWVWFVLAGVGCLVLEGWLAREKRGRSGAGFLGRR